MKNFLFILAFLFSSIANAQTWNTLQPDQTLPGLEENPLKGFVDLFNPSNQFPNSVSASLFNLDDLMLGLNNFNWLPIDNYLETEALKGNHSYIQVNIDPADGTTHMPGFLINQVDFFNYPGDPGNNIPPDACPDWNNPMLINAMLNFIDAFGQRYNTDDRVFMVHMGLYGMWGEWHIGSVQPIRPEFEMTEANRLAIANAYKNAFPSKILLARFPEHMPDPQLFGYSDGLFFTQSISDSQWDHGYFHNTLKSYNSDQNWRRFPTGGEIDPCVQTTIWQNWPNIDDTQCDGITQDVGASFSKIHPTWLFSHHVYSALASGSAEWNNAIRAQKLMGYTFYLDQYRLSAQGGFSTVEVNIQNTGIAPMYANWDIEIGVLDANNDFQLLDNEKWNINLIQPDAPDNYRSLTTGTTLTDGTYTFLLRIKNPLSTDYPNAKQVTFANATQDQDLAGWLTLGDMTIVSGVANTPPTQVLNMTISPNNATMVVDDVLQLSATVTPSTATNQAITWVSDHPGIAAVDTDGFVVAGPSYGTATITAYSQDGGISSQSQIIVEPLRVDIPALIEAENFIKMSGIAVLGISSTNSKLGFIDQEDWMEYGVTVNASANFVLNINAASVGGSEITVVDEGGNILEVIDIIDTDSFTVFDISASQPFALSAGNYNLRLIATEGNLDVDQIEFVLQSVLPVELLDFKAIPKTDHIQLTWSTLSELNNQGFHLERGTNATEFTEIAWLDGKGTTNRTTTYSLVDSEVEYSKDYYYRLAQKDFDGTITYSKITTAKLNKKGGDFSNALSIFPNPTNNIVTLSWEDAPTNATEYQIRILNIFGASISPILNNQKTIDLRSFPSGIYFLDIEIAGERIVKRVVKN